MTNYVSYRFLISFPQSNTALKSCFAEVATLWFDCWCRRWPAWFYDNTNVDVDYDQDDGYGLILQPRLQWCWWWWWSRWSRWWRWSDCPIGGSHCPAITHGSCDLLSTGAPKAWSHSHLTSLLLKITLEQFQMYNWSAYICTCTLKAKTSPRALLK